MIDERLRELGLTLPAATAPVANYVPFVKHGNVLHISGQISVDAHGQLITGRLGEDLGVEEGAVAAERCALALVSQLGAADPGFANLDRWVKLNVFVASAPGFTQQPQVANGASDLLVKLFGDQGRHARSAVGVAMLPLGVAVEIDALVALR
jgi:enamine deaminase RidA (YjgF/YER057c/UK114 family)